PAGSGFRQAPVAPGQRRKSRRLVSWAKRPWPQVLTWGHQPPRSAPPFDGPSQRPIPVVDHLHYSPTDIRPRGSDPRRNRLVSTPGGMQTAALYTFRERPRAGSLSPASPAAPPTPQAATPLPRRREAR